MNYIHCDYCDAHRPADIEGMLNNGRDGWVELKLQLTKLPESSHMPVTIKMDVCPACSHRLQEPKMMIKRGMANAR